MKHTTLFALVLLPLSAAFAASNSADQKFVEAAANGGMAEVDLGKLASTKAGSEPVRRFGEQMVMDHEPNNQKLKTIAMGKGLDVPADTDRMHKSMRSKLEGLSGEEFDKQYVKGQIADHKKMVTLMKKQAESGKDPELKSFAAQTLPVVQAHLDMLNAMKDGSPLMGAHSGSSSRH